MENFYKNVHVSKDGTEYEVRLIQDGEYFQGKIFINGFNNYTGVKTKAKANVIRWLNGYIDRLNIVSGISPKIPHVKYSTEVKPSKSEKTAPKPKTEKSKSKQQHETPKKEQVMVTVPVINIPPKTDDELTDNKQQKEEVQIVNTKDQNKKATPRKPFTPYGLNGYFVDKQGNVRLMLDHRASAKTITLSPDMFSSLAEMVRKTQEQHNELV